MASFQIKCSLCLRDFTDPVTLTCEHLYCRQCITDNIQVNLAQSCPVCEKPSTAKDLQPSRLLKNMTDAVQKHLSSFSSTSPSESPATLTDTLVCAEHDEKLKLFCETCQKLVCVVCRDGQKHQGHQFKPVEEAAQRVKEVLKDAVRFIDKDNRELDDMIKKQATEVTKTKMRSDHLSVQISSQFEELHQFLKKKEEEIKKELVADETNAVWAMSKNASNINEELMEGKEMESNFQSALAMTQPAHFLQWWNEKGFPVTERMKDKDNLGPEIKYRSRVEDLSVIPHSLFLGPSETHLQFFVWKEMLGAIKPVPETFTIKVPADSYLRVAPGGAHVWQARRKSNYFKDYNPGVVSTETFKDGQHYCEVEVGKKLDWSVGVKAETDLGVHLHLRHGKGYTLGFDGEEFSADVKGKPSRVGLYLDCERKRIYFYDADVMVMIFLTTYNSDLPWTMSIFPGLYLDGTNNDPITVCSYKPQ